MAELRDEDARVNASERAIIRALREQARAICYLLDEADPGNRIVDRASRNVQDLLSHNLRRLEREYRPLSSKDPQNPDSDPTLAPAPAPAAEG